MMNNILKAIGDSGLPLVPFLPEICKALDRCGAVIVRADPGSGKSTLVPLALADHCGGPVLMLEPRRAAAVGIASRMAELLGEEPGGFAGYAVRLERRVSARTRVEVVTEGLLVRRLQENPSLSGTVIFDEFHERSVHTDLAFAFVLDLRRMGAKVNIVIMSATMDTEKAAARIGEAENRAGGGEAAVIDCPGRAFPVETEYRPLPQKAPPEREWAAAVAGIAREEAAAGSGDILVFLPGRREIASCAGEISGQGLGVDFDIETLYGALPLARQREIIAPSRRHKRRVVLSTNVAETGLTIPGVTLVVDTGYARIQRFHIPSGLNRLSLEPVSGNSARQRAGRAGRLGPGRCVRLWAKGERRPEETAPEITRIDISGAVLECLIWGVKDISGLAWLDPPPQAAWNSALELLRDIGALDPENRPTGTGRQIARLGLDPRPGRLCIAGRDLGLASLACAAAAMLSERGDSGAGDDPDFISRLSSLRLGAAGPWQRRVAQAAADLVKRLGLSAQPQWEAADEARAGELLAPAFPDRIARRRALPEETAAGGAAGNASAYAGANAGGVFRFMSGREARAKAPLSSYEWICALEVDSGERMGFIRLAAPLSGEACLKALESRAVSEKTVQWKELVPRLIEVRKAGQITLGERQLPCRREDLLPALPSMLEEQGLAALPWGDGRGTAKKLIERIRFFAGAGDQALWSDETLIRDSASWLGPYVWDGNDAGRGEIIGCGGLCAALAGRLGWDKKREMDKEVPEQYVLPSGRKRDIDYGSGTPVIRLRLQDAFGIKGRTEIRGIPAVFHLLSPAGRPVQITSDLDGFWAGSYAEVRKEMRGRYPKHQWPENPKYYV